jgi:hypothetical protein
MVSHSFFFEPFSLALLPLRYIRCCSSAVFAALRYFVDSAEFPELSARQPKHLFHLFVADDIGVVRYAAQQLHAPAVEWPMSIEFVCRSLQMPRRTNISSRVSLRWIANELDISSILNARTSASRGTTRM